MTERGYALRDGDWRGRIEALAVFSAEAHGTYADPSTLFVHGLSCHLPLPHNAGSVIVLDWDEAPGAVSREQAWGKPTRGRDRPGMPGT